MARMEMLRHSDDLTIYSEIEYTRFFSEFEQGIEYIEALEKRLKRKKIIFGPLSFDFFKDHLKSAEKKYYETLRELFENDQDSNGADRLLIQKDLSFYIHNKYGIMNYLAEREDELLEEQEKNK
jgi:hypothetical protein